MKHLISARRIALFALFVATVGSPAGNHCAAQFRITNGNAEQTANIFLPAPRVLRQQLARAKKALADQRYAEAVNLLGRLLADPQLAREGDDTIPDQDYFLGSAAKEGTRTSLKVEAQRLLGEMPPKGRELYELKFGTEAQRLLDQAIQNADLRQLTQVTRRYFHTKAGYQATMLLGRHELDQGRPLAAALCFQRLAKSSYARTRYDPELSVLLAASWLFAGDEENARQVLTLLRRRDAKATLTIGGEKMSLFAKNQDPIQWLRQVIGKGFAVSEQGKVEWKLYRGDADRNAASHAGFPLLNVRWRVRVTNDPTDEQLIQAAQRNFWDQGVPAMCSLQPLAVSDVILMRTPRRVIAVDFKTGKRVWEFPWFEAPERAAASGRQVPRNLSLATRQTQLNQRVWDDAAYGQMSSDGQRLFFLWQLGYADAKARSMGGIIMPPGRLGTDPNAPRDVNKLVALDLSQEGKLHWIVGGTDGTDEPKLAGAFFLGPPLPLMDCLYVLAEVNAELRLVVLENATGRQLWTQQLGHLDARKIPVDAPRRLAGASPSYSDGVLVCPTAAGAVVAVDLATRSLLWGYQYPQASIPTRVMMGAMRFPLRPTGQRWADGTVTIARGRVLLTPVESDYLYCLDLLTGKPVWKPRPRNGMLYLACVANENAILVGKNRIEAVALADGATRWTLPLEAEMPAGRGMLADDCYYLATTARRLLKIDLKTGRIVRESQTNDVLGNLLAYQDQIISQSAEWLAAYYQTKPLRGLVASRLKQNPDDIWALARQAELMLYDGRRREAVAVLRRAQKIAPDNDSIHALLVESIVAALRDDFAANRQLAADLDSMIDQPQQRLEYDRLMAVGLQRVGEYTNALKYYIKFGAIEDAGAMGSPKGQAPLLTIGPQLRVSRDRWVRMQVAQMLAKVKPEVRQQIEAAIQKHLVQTIARHNPKTLARFIEHFASSRHVGTARLELAKLLLERKDYLAAEQQLLALQSDPQADRAAVATARLAHMLHRMGREQEAFSCYAMLDERWPDVKLDQGKTGGQLFAEAEADAAFQNLLHPLAHWPRGKVQVHTGPSDVRYGRYQRIYSVPLIATTPPFPAHAQLAYNFNLNSLILYDQCGRVLQQALLGDRNRFFTSYYAANRAAARGHLILAAVGFELLAVDSLRATDDSTDPILWRQDLSGTVTPPSQRQRSLMANTISRSWGPSRILPRDQSRRPIGLMGPVTENGVTYQKLHDIVCADPLTNQVFWKRSGFAAGSDIFGDSEYLFVVEPDAHVATVLRASDGTKVDQREVGQRVSRWITRGRKILNCQMRNSHLIVRWYDAWSQKTIWRHEFAAYSQCWQIDQDSVAVLERSGKLLVFSLATGKPCFETQLKKEPRLARLYVLPSENNYFVVANQQNTSSVSSSVTGTRISGVTSTIQCPLINGHIYALDRRSGKPTWPSPALIRQFALPLNQPVATPTLVFFRHISRRKPGSTSRSSPTTASIVCIDKRDGRQLLGANELPIIQYYKIEADPEDHTVTVGSNARTFTLTFTDEPVKDAKPLQQEDPTAAINALKEVGRIAGSIVQAISRANDDQPKKKKKETKGKKKGKDEK